MTVIGSLCSGYGGLDLGLILALGGGRVAWHAEYDDAPAKILAHHWPDVLNLRDITTVDWSKVEPVDWLTAGYPCQPFSLAGKRKGSSDERHLWPYVADAIRVLRPRRVLLENVAGHVSMGLDRVLADLAALGYRFVWGVVRASDAGAPHGRARLFVVATDTDSRRSKGERFAGGDGAKVPGIGSPGTPPPADTAGVGRGEGRPEPARRGGGPTTVLGRASAPDADGDGLQGVGRVVGVGRDLDGRRRADGPRPTGEPQAAPDAEGERRHGRGDPRGRRTGPPDRRLAVADADGTGPQGREPTQGHDLPAWGAYGPAIARWEAVLGRRAPGPTEPGRNGPRLAPVFVEWMQGLPAGHVTAVPGLTRSAQLKALGNGVVPQQGALAVRTLLAIIDREDAAA